MSALINKELDVVNVGLSSFADNINHTGAKVTHIDWKPPAQGDRATGLKLAHVMGHEKRTQANQNALEKITSARPVLVDIAFLKDAVQHLPERIILHAGPPISWDTMCGPMQGGVVGAILYEGWATSETEARDLAKSGEIVFAPNHNYNAVGPMAGIISPSMPVWVVENQGHGNMAYSNFNEGLGEVLRFGAYSPDVLKRLAFMRDILYPALKKAVFKSRGIDLKVIIAQALTMGDECHNRNNAASALFLKAILPYLFEIDVPNDELTQIVGFINANNHFFLNLSMAACKSSVDAASNIPHSSIVTVMARNGVNFGIKVSGCGDTWFEAEALTVKGLYFTGYSEKDAALDLGDSSITETAGIGGFAMASSPAIVQFVGGTPEMAVHNTNQMKRITQGKNNMFTIPILNFEGAPCGIDIVKVLDRRILPTINTGIAHKDAGVGQIGAGITSAPIDCFIKAINNLYTQSV